LLTKVEISSEKAAAAVARHRRADETEKEKKERGKSTSRMDQSRSLLLLFACLSHLISFTRKNLILSMPPEPFAATLFLVG
jgi:hypothetical protein